MIAPQTEAGFTAAVIAAARLHGWRAAHFRPAQTGRGWRTAVQGDGVGFPDLIMVRGSRCIVAELKRGKNKASSEQEAWLAAFRQAGIPAYIWRPTDWAEINQVLAGDAAR